MSSPSDEQKPKAESIFIRELGFDGWLFRLMMFAGLMLLFADLIGYTQNRSRIGWILCSFGPLCLLLRAIAKD